MSSMVTIPSITAITDPPSLQDPANFPDRGDAFLGALPNLGLEINAFVDALNQNKATIESAAANAGISASPAYDSGTTYNYPDIVAGSDGYTYRCIGTDVLDDDPVGSSSGNWRNLTPGITGLYNSVVTKTSAYTLEANDKGKMFSCTGTWTFTIPAATGFSDGFTNVYKNDGTGQITLGTTGVILGPGESCFLSSNGAAWKVSGLWQQALSAAETYYNGITTDSDYACIRSSVQGFNEVLSHAAAKRYACSVKLADGRIFVVGGYTSVAIATSHIYDPSTGLWDDDLEPLPVAKYGACAALLPNGDVLVVCGRGDSSFYSSAHTYNVATDTWTAATSHPSAAKNYAACCVLADGKVMVIGGTTNGSTETNEVHVYDPAGAGTWAAKATHPVALQKLTASLLPDGKVLTVGGQTSGAVAVVYNYDPVANSWSAAKAPIPSSRYLHNQVTLLDGSVLVAGGNNGTSSLSTMYAYYYLSDTWMIRTSLPGGRYGGLMNLLDDGNVFFSTAGYVNTYLLDIINTWKRAS